MPLPPCLADLLLASQFDQCAATRFFCTQSLAHRVLNMHRYMRLQFSRKVVFRASSARNANETHPKCAKLSQVVSSAYAFSGAKNRERISVVCSQSAVALRTCFWPAFVSS